MCYTYVHITHAMRTVMAYYVTLNLYKLNEYL
jgi:hypothetical protein